MELLDQSHCFALGLIFDVPQMTWALNAQPLQSMLRPSLGGLSGIRGIRFHLHSSGISNLDCHNRSYQLDQLISYSFFILLCVSMQYLFVVYHCLYPIYPVQPTYPNSTT
ncbi:hypothetical protein ASPWEDRAFT_42024 [Aspergillus wentii DTO 134E9]|uniref:Uncharacterized protein n=1 Tax=Aspergillus wentii DTO 134E9 TaxID=1073089 RepID=A0A1L9RGX0_ASPWE|nr:uncharacterized protein ASPWEDRAFT_42024 [Aspergillus wentii DTO 134E9]OJJ34108.1 hypothetical protein ASPWEDRAFT_42024 [Aspergillus wentii DTO 134E9]